MNIPKLYSEKLEANKFLKGIIYSATETFGEILEENNLFFFDEYTDHGIKHIEAVLQTTINIIPESSFQEFIDDENVGVIILSVLLHDIGMHQTYSSFLHLIKQKTILIPELDDSCWNDLWENYTEEAKKFNSQTKKDIFGDYDYVITIPDFKNIDLLDGYQKKLIGEFIRRHHPRIAHEIALYGFQTEKSVLKFPEMYDLEKLDIVGLIARSHGIDIRRTYDYIQRKFFKINKTPHNIHVFYLMSILRIADYFQIDINRLSLVSLKLKTFKSPISEVEHTKHFSIKEIKSVEEDPETLFIRALPSSNLIYWKLIDLISDFQNELDKCWAVLGEKYGKDIDKPLLKYRRITSNLQEKNYLDSLSFVPEKILFGSDPDLARLLVEPLYGDNPTYGVRELLQNSIDAIHERSFLEKAKDNVESIIEINILHDLNEEYYFQIKDNGKGMSIKEIKNYFLKAGSTNRKSKEWDELYITADRNTSVLKSGKFGVGILAAFLIGDELEVSTRRFDSINGLYFKAGINSKDIEVVKTKDLPIGTSIKIKLKLKQLKYFMKSLTELIEWDKWYTLNNPKIKFNCLLGFNRKYGYDEFDPSFYENENWIEFSSEGYTKLRWTYGKKKGLSENKYQLTCNGLIIPLPPPIQIGSIPPPHIQVFDFNGILPINLNRNALDTNFLPFEKDLISSIFKTIFKEILKTPPHIIIHPEYISMSQYPQYPVLVKPLKVADFFNGFVYTSSGYYLKNSYLSDFVKDKRVIRLSIKASKLERINIKIDPGHIVEIAYAADTGLKIQGYVEAEAKRKMIDWLVLQPSNSDYEWFEKDPDYVIETKKIKSKEIVVIKKKEIRKTPIFLGMLTELELENLQSIICFSSIRYSIGNMNGEFNQYLSDIFSKVGNPIIPYDEELRKEKIDSLIKLLD